MRKVSKQGGIGERMTKTVPYIQPKPVKSRGINSDAGIPADDRMLPFGYPV